MACNIALGGIIFVGLKTLVVYLLENRGLIAYYFIPEDLDGKCFPDEVLDTSAPAIKPDQLKRKPLNRSSGRDQWQANLPGNHSPL